jgi:Zn-dependent peptidase ImmA (M78 family)
VLQRKCACGSPAGTFGECEACAKERPAVRRDGAGRDAPGSVPPIVHEVLRSPGQPLDPATRAFMEPRFGHDFSRVRVHADARAAESARAVNALAYAVGRDVVFGAGRHAPQTKAGQALLAHELAHVVQQRQATASGELSIGLENDPHEREAETAARSLAMPFPDRQRSSEAKLQRVPAELVADSEASDEAVESLEEEEASVTQDDQEEEEEEEEEETEEQEDEEEQDDSLEACLSSIVGTEGHASPEVNSAGVIGPNGNGGKRRRNTRARSVDECFDFSKRRKRSGKPKQRLHKKRRKIKWLKCCIEYDLSSLNSEQLPAGRQPDISDQETNRDLPPLPRGCSYTVQWDMHAIPDHITISDNKTGQVYWDENKAGTGECQIPGPADVHIRVVPHPTMKPTAYNYTITKSCGRVKRIKACYFLGGIPLKPKITYIPYDPKKDYSKKCDGDSKKTPSKDEADTHR